MPYVITSPCIDCVDGACVTACPVDCIHPSERMFYIDPVTCVDCGACESLCPVEAIYKSRWVPSAEQGFIAINEQATAGLAESDRGTARPIADHSAIAASPSVPST